MVVAIYIIAWILIGYFSEVITSIIEKSEVSVGDSLIGAFLGPITFFINIAHLIMFHKKDKNKDGSI